MATTEGTPCLLLGFAREELDAMEERAFPEPIEAWLHGLIAAALRGEVVYEHRWADEPAGDAAAVTIPKFAGSRASITENPARWMVRFDCGHVGGPFYTDQHPFPPAVLHCGECRALRTAVETFTPDFKD